MMRVSVLCIFAVLIDVCDAQQTSRPTLPPVIPDRGEFSGMALLRVEPEVVSAGDVLKIECEARCTGLLQVVFNPLLSARDKLPAQITITSAERSVRHELLYPSVDKEQPADATRWLRLWDARSAGREFTFRIASDKGTGFDDVQRERRINLAPGE